MPRFYLIRQFYGGDIPLIKQAAQEHNVTLLAVANYAVEDYPGDPEYIEGPHQYIFTLEAQSERDAHQLFDQKVRMRIVELARAKGW
jgi:hypothetical protein